MAEPPSDALLRTLYGLRLCTAADVARCHARVRRMASGLPAFDSVWIDALQQIGRLTPFQARALDAGQGESLRVGPCVLVDRLGPARTGRTFVARHRDSEEHCVLKIVDPDDDSREFRVRARELAAANGATRSETVLGPHRFEEHDGRFVAVSRWIDGPSLEELLIRRGRFPHRIVAAVARQLAEGLAALASRNLLHGDLRPTNVRLRSDGRVVAVDAGVRPLMEGEVRLRDGDDPARFDGVAPERIGNGRPPTEVSEVYAFGCLVWTLLAGRPPFPTGDVLGKLAAHRSRELPDIELIAPDTPPELVRLVTATTHRDPAERPQTFAEVARALGAATSGGRGALAAFLSAFDRSVPRLPRRVVDETAARGGGMVAAGLVLAGLASTMLHEGIRGRVAGWTSTATNTVAGWFGSGPETEPAEAIADGDVPPTQEDTRPTLPEPDADGLVVLNEPGPYRVTELSTVGSLTLRAADGVRPVIEVDETPLKLWAEEVRIENVTIRASGSPVSALVLARSQKTELTGVTLDGGTNADSPDDARTGSSARYLLAWKPLDERDATGGEIVLRETVLLGAQPALFASVPPRRLAAEQTLKVGRGAFVEFATNPAPGADVTLAMSNVTLRDATHLLRCVRRRSDAGVTWIEADDCVFDLVGSDASLLAWIGPRADAPDRVQLEGRGSLTTPNVPVAVLVAQDGRRFDAGEHGNVIVEGLLPSRIEFAGPANDPAGSTVERFDGPRIVGERPGFDATRIAADPSRRFQ